MNIQLLGALVVAGLAGPLLRIPKRWGVPVAVGELIIGGAFGASGFNKIPYQDPSLKLLATVGFALLMFTAGSHIDYRTLTKASTRKAIWILCANGVVALVVALLIEKITHFQNWKLLAVICFSSSAALVIPILQSFDPSLSGSILITQVTLADAIAFLLLPFFTQSHNHLKATEGALIILVASFLIYQGLNFAKARGWLDQTHRISKEDHLGLELRISLALLLLVSALAIHLHASVMIAGFTLGVALASVGVPHRLARQLFGVSEGFFAPLYFVWLGASINLRDTFQSKNTILLALALFLGALISHLPSLLFHQPKRNVFLAAAQLGIPAAAVTLGTANRIISGGESGAIMLSAVLTILCTI